MNTTPYDNIEFSSKREKARFASWLERTPFSLQGDNLYVRPEQIDWSTVRELFQAYRQRHREGWYCSFEDSYGDALRKMCGESPLVKASFDEQLEEARELSVQNIRICVSKLIQLAKQGQPEAMLLAAEFFLNGRCVKQDEKLAAEYALRSCEAGFEGANGLLSMMYATGIGFEKNDEKAKLYREVVEKSGHAYCLKYLGIMYMEGMGVELNVHKGRECLLKSIELGDMEAVTLLALYNVYRKVNEDVGNDMKYLFASAKLHEPSAMALAGKLLIQTGAIDNSFELIRDGMGYMVNAANAAWPEAVRFLDDEYALIELGDGSVVERGEFCDIEPIVGEYSSGRRYRLVDLPEKDEDIII